MGRLLPFLTAVAVFASVPSHAQQCPSGQEMVMKIQSYQRADLLKGHCQQVGAVVENLDSCFKDAHSGPGVYGTCSYTLGQVTVTLDDGTHRRLSAQFPGSCPYGNPPTTTQPSTLSGTVYGVRACGVPPDPEPENPCEEKSSRNDTFRYNGTGPSDFPAVICKGGCRMSNPEPFLTLPGDGTFFSGHATYTGQECATGDKQSPNDVPEEVLADGTEGVCSTGTPKVCVSKDKQNCGYVNGEYRCVTSTQLTDENPCVQTTSGAVMCKADAPPDAVPNNGTPGQPAQPDAQFGLKPPSGNQITVNYYSPSTVAGSSENPGNDAGSDQDGDGRPDGNCKGTAADPCHVVVDEGGTADLGGGGGGGDGEGDGYGEGDGDCTGENCGVGAPGFGGVDDFGVTLAKFVNNVQTSSVATAVGTIATAVPEGGQSPSSCFNVFGQQFCYAVPPEIEAAVRSILPLIMKAVWCLIAIVVFMKA